mgnify:CR=1 FL=1
MMKEIECNFPTVQISELAEQESWRKEINRPLYHIHKWWATRLGSVFRAIILGALSPKGADAWENFYKINKLSRKIVLDPFMGSGTTLGETIKLGAKAIGCDINPVSTFLVRQEFNNVSQESLCKTFDHIEKNIAQEIKKYYKTYDPETGSLIDVLYYFWVKVVQTPSGEEIPLFTRYIFSQDAYPQKKPRAQILCPNCWNIIVGRYDDISVTCSNCNFSFNPQQGPVSGQYVTDKYGNKYKIKDLVSQTNTFPQHRMYAMMALHDNGEKVYLPIKEYDINLYKEAESRLKLETSLPLPNLLIRPGYNTNQAIGYNYIYWRDFFNSRQLLCLGLLLNEIKNILDISIQEQFICLFSSILEFNNMFCSFKGEGTGAVRHMFANHILKPEKTPLENSIWGTEKSSGTFASLFKSRLLRARQYADAPFEIKKVYDKNGRKKYEKVISSPPIHSSLVETWDEFCQSDTGVFVLNADSSKLPIPDKSVDAVITDPPYFDFVHYSELSDFFFAWLSPILRNRYSWMANNSSSNTGEVQHSDAHHFSTQLCRVFAEMQRVLKDDGILAFSFHHSRPDGWAAIYTAINEAQLSVVATYPVHAELRAASPKSIAKDPISLDAILVCRKKISTVSSKNKQYTISHEEIERNLKNSGLRISRGDTFVIGASQLLIKYSDANLSFEQINDIIQNFYFSIREYGQG